MCPQSQHSLFSNQTQEQEMGTKQMSRPCGQEAAGVEWEKGQEHRFGPQSRPDLPVGLLLGPGMPPLSRSPHLHLCLEKFHLPSFIAQFKCSLFQEALWELSHPPL